MYPDCSAFGVEIAGHIEQTTHPEKQAENKKRSAMPNKCQVIHERSANYIRAAPMTLISDPGEEARLLCTAKRFPWYYFL